MSILNKNIRVLPAIEILLAAKSIFSSKAEIKRAVQAKSVKINRIQVDSIDEPIDFNWFVAGLFLPNGFEFMKQYGMILAINLGKKRGAIVLVTDTEVKEIITG